MNDNDPIRLDAQRPTSSYWKKGLSGLTDDDLLAETRRAYEAHMLLEVAGDAYLTSHGANRAAAARSYYYRLSTEVQRRKLKEII